MPAAAEDGLLTAEDVSGLDLLAAELVLSARRRITRNSHGRRNEDLLELLVTVLFPSALENVIRRENVPRVRAK